MAGSEPVLAAAAEAFTAMREAERRKNVEIITVDREYDPTQQGGYADGYKPKVPDTTKDSVCCCCGLMLWMCAQGRAAFHVAQQYVSSSVCVRVATWGVFPRPPDISRAYGGGRTLKPGQELESEDDRAARARRVTEVPPAPRTCCQSTRSGSQSTCHLLAGSQ